MNNSSYPAIHERYRTQTFSSTAHCITTNVITTHHIFINGSVFANALYRQKLRYKFDKYATTWKNETLFSSNPESIINNAAYNSVIALGSDVVPFIIEDLKKTSSHWFYALESLTGENPIKREHWGIVSAMKEDWLNWANETKEYDENFYSNIS